jgi:hypothetical protein
LPNIIFAPTHLFRHNLYADTSFPFANLLVLFQTCFLLSSKTLRRLCRWIERTGVFRLPRPTGTCRSSWWPCKPRRMP